MNSFNKSANLRFSLRDVRLATTGIGQRKVARAVDIDVEALRAYEKGRAIPPDDVLEKLLAFYNPPEFMKSRLALTESPT